MRFEVWRESDGSRYIVAEGVDVVAAWDQSSSPESFVRALEARGVDPEAARAAQSCWTEDGVVMRAEFIGEQPIFRSVER